MTEVPTIKTNHKTARFILIGAICLSLALYLPLILHNSDSLTFGRFVGLIGLQLIWWQIVLGNRQLTRFLTPDLLWVNKLHRFLGTYGFLLILLHPTLMLVSYGLSLVWPPSFATRFDIGVRLGTTALMLMSFIWFISALFRKKLAWRWWKRLHLLAYIVFPILYVHMLLVGSSMQRYWWLTIWLSTIIVVYCVILLLRALSWAGVTKLHYTVVETTLVAKDVTRFRLQPVGKSIKPRPGQFAYFQGWKYGEAHPFTVSLYDDSSEEISFSIKAVGPYSRKLSELEAGETVYIDGPYGVFTQEMANSDRPVVAIAGGIGITPFLRNLELGYIDYLFLGCRAKEDIPYPYIIDTSKASVCYVLSEATEKEQGYEVGTIDVLLLEKKLEKSLSEYDFYLCGPPPMMKKLFDELTRHSVPPSNIYQENFSL